MQLDNFNLTYEVMMEDAREFLENVYPGAKGKPTKFVQTMASSNPEKTIQSAALLIQEEEKECSSSASEGIAQILVNVNHPQQSMLTLNLYDICRGNVCKQYCLNSGCD